MRLFSKSCLFLYLFFLGFVFSSTSPAQEIDPQSFHTPENFYWRRFETKAGKRFELWSFQGQPTNIYFVFEPVRNDIVEKETRDPGLQLFIPSPFRSAYEAHPEFEKSLEEEFVRALEFLNIEGLATSTEVRSSESKPFGLDFDALVIPESVASINRWINELENEIRETEDWALQGLGINSRIPGRQFLNDFNPVEAIRSIEGGRQTRLDAFVLSPLKSLENEGERILDALEELALQPEIYILEWFFRSFHYSVDLRLSVLMLITHNHVAEDWFIRACALKFGVEKAWETFQHLNRIYKNERHFWRHPQRHREKTKDAQLPSHIQAPLKIAEVDVSPETRILSKMYGMPSLSEKAAPEWLPYTQLYHYYGAFILSHILHQRKNVREEFLVELVSSFGLTYKLKTAGFQRAQLERILSFYKTGAEHYLFLKDFIR